ncbi:hypothetical protein M8J77_016368 [Diaphorina citri]|nr:hypothetical protein M8J77_016368 [Diaphorina citri]
MLSLKSRSSRNEDKILEDYLKASFKEDYRSNPASLKSFLTDEEYEAVAQMLDLPPLRESPRKISADSSIRTFKQVSSPADSSSEDKWEMSVNLGSIISTSKSKRYPSGNPYLKFLRNPEKHATKWRKPVPMRAKDILNASTVEKSKFITDKIIGDFIKWKETICDSKDVEIDETVMSQLFEIGIKKPDNVKIFRRKAIPRDIFEPKMMKQTVTWTHVKKHFGKSLGTKTKQKEHLLVKCSKDLIKQKSKMKQVEIPDEGEKKHPMWAKCERNINEIVSSVWKNKLNYKCVQAFCEYLEQNPHISKPDYLIQMNMFSNGG